MSKIKAVADPCKFLAEAGNCGVTGLTTEASWLHTAGAGDDCARALGVSVTEAKKMTPKKLWKIRERTMFQRALYNRINPFSHIAGKWAALAVAIVTCGCQAQEPTSPVAPLPVSRVLTAHHGKCPPKSNRIFGESAAHLFSAPIEYRPYNCMSHPMAEILRGGCGGTKLGHNTVFVTLGRAQPVRFTQNGHEILVHVKTFGEDWNPRDREANLYFADKDFPKPPPPPNEPILRYRGPEMYGEFGPFGDVLGIASSECPTG